jgi:hypothetical protein
LKYVIGGIIPKEMSRKDRQKEEELYVLRETFLADLYRGRDDISSGYDYVSRVGMKMRQYNVLSESPDNENDV